MRRILIGPLNSAWSDLLQVLIRDLAPLGHSISSAANGHFEVTVAEALDFPRSKESGRLEFYDAAHEICYAQDLRENAAFIKAFEAEHADIFARMDSFQPSAILPKVEIVDFKDPRHQAIVAYMGLYQTVISRKLVGRRMGLLVWDDGQTAARPLIGCALLASARWSQRLRDQVLGWPAYFPRTSPRHDAEAREIRIRGLARIMQLSVACALPPYSVLSGAWFVALLPFTAIGQEAFARAARKEADADLAALVTTTAKGESGAPFQAQRIEQLTQGTVKGAGDVFRRAVPAETRPPLRASFRRLISDETMHRATALFAAEFPDEPLEIAERRALGFALRRLKLNSRIFAGNEIGVHVGMLQPETRHYLETGEPRPAGDRLRLDGAAVTSVWLKRFLPEANADTIDQHRAARIKRADRARAFPQDQIPLSFRLDDRVGENAPTANSDSERLGSAVSLDPLASS